MTKSTARSTRRRVGSLAARTVGTSLALVAASAASAYADEATDGGSEAPEEVTAPAPDDVPGTDAPTRGADNPATSPTPEHREPEAQPEADRSEPEPESSPAPEESEPEPEPERKPEPEPSAPAHPEPEPEPEPDRRGPTTETRSSERREPPSSPRADDPDTTNPSQERPASEPAAGTEPQQHPSERTPGHQDPEPQQTSAAGGPSSAPPSEADPSSEQFGSGHDEEGDPAAGPQTDEESTANDPAERRSEPAGDHDRSPVDHRQATPADPPPTAPGTPGTPMNTTPDGGAGSFVAAPPLSQATPTSPVSHASDAHLAESSSTAADPVPAETVTGENNAHGYPVPQTPSSGFDRRAENVAVDHTLDGGLDGTPFEADRHPGHPRSTTRPTSDRAEDEAQPLRESGVDLTTDGRDLPEEPRGTDDRGERTPRPHGPVPDVGDERSGRERDTRTRRDDVERRGADEPRESRGSREFAGRADEAATASALRSQDRPEREQPRREARGAERDTEPDTERDPERENDRGRQTHLILQLRDIVRRGADGSGPTPASPGNAQRPPRRETGRGDSSNEAEARPTPRTPREERSSSPAPVRAPSTPAAPPTSTTAAPTAEPSAPPAPAASDRSTSSPSSPTTPSASAPSASTPSAPVSTPDTTSSDGIVGLHTPRPQTARRVSAPVPTHRYESVPSVAPTSAGSPPAAAAPPAPAPAPVRWPSGVVQGSGRAEAQRGRPADVHVVQVDGQSWGTITAVDAITPVRDTDARVVVRTPMLPSGGGFELRQCTAGDFREQWTAFATRLKDLDGPIVDLGPAMNEAGVPWQGDPAAYAACFADVARTVKKTAPNVAFQWTPTIGSRPGMPGEAVVAAWPGADVVDVIGVDATADGRPWQEQLGGAYGLNYWASVADRHGKRIAVARWGVHAGARQDRSVNAAYVRNMHDWIARMASKQALAYEAYREPADVPREIAAAYRDLF